MRKGDETRLELLRISEELFCTRGFEETSIQNILDVIHGSKGGFYHHFDSKEDVLRTICQRRAAASAEQTGQELAGMEGSLKRLNHVLCRMMPLQEQDWTFMAMLLPILDRRESVPVRVGYQEALTEAYLPLLQREVEQAQQEELLSPVSQRAPQAVLALLNDCWAEAACRLLQDLRAGVRTENAVLLDILADYRKCTEALLDAPFGSIELMRLEDWQCFAQEMARSAKIPRKPM